MLGGSYDTSCHLGHDPKSVLQGWSPAFSVGGFAVKQTFRKKRERKILRGGEKKKTLEILDE